MKNTIVNLYLKVIFLVYEIPANLQYKEKIMFNLTVGQLFWLGTFGIISAIIFVRLPTDITIRFLVALPFMVLGAAFAFFGLFEHVKNLWVFHQSIKKAGFFDQKLAKFVEIQRIEDNVVFLKDGSIRAVLQIMPLNFCMLSKPEQEAIIQAFKEFLNSLDFSVQIVMRTTSLNLADYLKKLELDALQTKNPVLLEQFKSFDEFVQKHITEKKVKNRQFYLVIPYSPAGRTNAILDFLVSIQNLFSKEKKKTSFEVNQQNSLQQLDIRVKLCQQKLKKANLLANRLGNEELLSLLAAFFEEFFETKNEYFASHRPKELAELVRPSFVHNEMDSIRVNGSFNRVVMAVGYPRSIQEGWLDRIVSAEGTFDLSLHVEPASIELILGKLNQELVKQKSDILASETRGIVNPSLKVQYDDTYKTLQALQSGEEKLFNLSFYVNARALDKNELELATRKIESELNSMMILPKTPYFRMQQALQSVIPLAQDKLRIQRNIPSSPLAACFPFTSSFLDLKEDGIMFGVNIANNIPIILNQYDFANYNGLVLGSSGGGKSFFVKLYLIRNLLKDTQCYIIDPQGEYSDLCQKYDGQLVNISRESETIINPLDLMGRDFGDKVLSLMDLFRIMFGELTEVQKNTLDKALILTYKKKGILSNLPETWKLQPPVLSDLFETLEEQGRKASQIEKMTYDALLNRLQIYAHGSFSFLNKQTSLNLEKKLISFNIKEMPNQVKPALMFLVLDFIYEKTQKNLERKIIVVDEAWQLLRHGEHAEYLFKICKTARKFGTGLVIITQEVNDLLNSPAGNTILANTAWKLLLRQDPAVSMELAEKFGLNKEEKNFILTVDKGEGLLFAMNDRLPIKIIASEKEYDIITTNPEELRKREILREKLLENEDLSQEVYSLSKKYYPVSELNEKQIDFLKSVGYLETKQMGLEAGGLRSFLVNPHPENESVDHKFLVQLLYEEIQKRTEKVVRYAVQQPDLVFIANGKRIAFEIETGKMLENQKELIEKTESLKKFDSSYFIVTDKYLKPKYEKLAPTLTRIEAKQKISELFNSLQVK